MQLPTDPYLTVGIEFLANRHAKRFSIITMTSWCHTHIRSIYCERLVCTLKKDIYIF